MKSNTKVREEKKIWKIYDFVNYLIGKKLKDDFFSLP